MSSSLDEETLEQVAKDGSMDYERWPALLGPLLRRLDQIAHNDFPIPTIPAPDWLRPPPNEEEPSDLATATIEDATNSDSTTQAQQSQQRPLPPVPPFDPSTTSSTTTTAASTSNILDSVLPSQTSLAANSVPDLLIQQLTSICYTLRTAFADKPPHTIQRLAELVLSPTKYYKTLPAWLRAVDRAVSVTSSAEIFPLPQAQSLPQGVLDSALTNGMTNGLGSGTGGGGILWTNSDTRDGGLGSDESLGGALLTPIPWLKNGEIADTVSPRSDPLEPLDAPSSSAFVLERQDGAVTQGELIRMEQEAGIVPLRQTVAEGGDVEIEGEGAEVVPYARGPDVVGVEDMGLQDGKDVQVQISKESSPKPEQVMVEDVKVGSEPDLLGDTTKPSDDDNEHEEEMPVNGDGDIVLTDADGKTEDSDSKADISGGENVGPDSVNTTSL